MPAHTAPGTELEVDKKDPTAKVKATTAEETADTKVLNNEQSNTKPKEVPAPGVGSEIKELTIESLLQGLRLKKDIQLGKISEPTWKNQKPAVTKVRM